MLAIKKGIAYAKCLSFKGGQEEVPKACDFIEDDALEDEKVQSHVTVTSHSSNTKGN